MSRFICLRWPPAEHALGRQAVRLAERLEADGAQWRRLIVWRGVIVMCAGGPAFVCERGYAAIIGDLFRRDETAPGPAALSPQQTLAAAETGGRLLIQDFFGGYVAFLADHARDDIHVLRDPTAACPCWVGSIGAIRVVFSHACDFAALGGALDIAERRLAGFLLQPRLAMRASGFDGVEEIFGGERLTLGRDYERREAVWRLAPPEAAPMRFDQARDCMRAEVLRCVSAWAAGKARIALKLSGGLDSSIVLSCLRQASPHAEIVCVNLYSRAAPEGDERLFAKAAANAAGQAFVALETRPEEVRYERVLDAPLFPAPVRSVLDWASAEIVDRIAALNAEALLSGQGGDHVFHRSRTPLIAADAVREGMRLSDWGEVALDTAHVSGQSVWAVGAAALKHGLMRRPFDLYALWRRERRLIKHPDWSVLEDLAAHPWLEGWRAMPAGHAMRVALLLDAVCYNDPTLLRTRIPCIAPLFSQPIIDLSMQLAPRIMTAGGVDRALLRAAFSDDLPQIIKERQTKGETTRYFAAVIAGNRSVLSDLLLGGGLRERRLIDVHAVERALRMDATSNEGVNDLLILLAAEAWLHSVDRAKAATLDAASSS